LYVCEKKKGETENRTELNEYDKEETSPSDLDSLKASESTVFYSRVLMLHAEWLADIAKLYSEEFSAFST